MWLNLRFQDGSVVGDFYMSQRVPTKWHVRPAKTQISLGAQSDQSPCCPDEESLGS